MGKLKPGILCPATASLKETVKLEKRSRDIRTWPLPWAPCVPGAGLRALHRSDGGTLGLWAHRPQPASKDPPVAGESSPHPWQAVPGTTTPAFSSGRLSLGSQTSLRFLSPAGTQPLPTKGSCSHPKAYINMKTHV